MCNHQPKNKSNNCTMGKLNSANLKVILCPPHNFNFK